jgi:hypothetical protein
MNRSLGCIRFCKITVEEYGNFPINFLRPALIVATQLAILSRLTFLLEMNTNSILPDYHDVARQIVRLSDIRQKSPQAANPSMHARNFSDADSRYYAITALVATAIEPRKAGAVTKKLLPGLDAYENEKLVGLPAEELEIRRTEFVERFLKFEYAGSA